MTSPVENDNLTLTTAKLFGIILKLPLEDRLRLLSDLERHLKGERSSIRRKHPRKNILINVDYTVNKRLYNGIVINMSAAGVFIESPKVDLPKFNPGDEVILTFEHPERKQPMRISGEIIRIDKKGIGIKFANPILELLTP